MKKYIILVASIVFILSISAVSAGLLDGLFDGSNTPINSNEKAEFKNLWICSHAGRKAT